jgi:hypothetical protein
MRRARSARPHREQVVLRMRATGGATTARLELLSGVTAAEGTAQRSNWLARPAATVTRAAPSSAGAAAVLDGDAYTM